MLSAKRALLRCLIACKMKSFLIFIMILLNALFANCQCYKLEGSLAGATTASDLSMHINFDSICVDNCYKFWLSNRNCDFLQNVTISWVFEGSVGNDSIVGDTVTVCFNEPGGVMLWIYGSSTFSADSGLAGDAIGILPCPPTADLLADRIQICTNECVQFSDPLSHVADTWEWYFPGGVPERFTGREPPPVCYPDTGLYDASVTVTSKWGSTTAHKPGYIHVTAGPTPVEVDTVFRIGEGENVILPAPARGDSYSWEPLLEVTENHDTVLNILPSESRYYTATVANANGCSVIQRYEVRVLTGLLVPTAFTPNNDGQNDYFRVLNTNVEVTSVSIWNRWGEQVYRDLGNYGWDGTYKGEPADMGIYIWYIEYYVLATAKKRTATGNITLVR